MDAKTDDKGPGKCPFTGGTRGHANRDWWPDHLNIGVLHQNAPAADPMGKAFDYAKEFDSLDLDAVIKDLTCLDDGLAGVVAGRLRSLRPVLHPHGVAQRGHVSHRRRPRRRRARPAALRAAQLLAGQRQPRQGAPAAVADQAEVRPENLLGRPDDPHRQRRPRIRWASRRSVSAAAAPTCGSRKQLYWGPEGTWLGDERYSGERELPDRSAPCRWA